MQHETLLRLARYIHVILPGLLVADAVHNAFVVHNLWQDRRKVCPFSWRVCSAAYCAHCEGDDMAGSAQALTGWVSMACTLAGMASRGQGGAAGRRTAHAAGRQLALQSQRILAAERCHHAGVQ